MKLRKAENAREDENCRIETFRILRVIRGWNRDVAGEQRAEWTDEVLRRESANKNAECQAGTCH